MQRKYEFTGEVKVVLGRTLRRIKATMNFGFVIQGQLGGFIQSEENLKHDDRLSITLNRRLAQL